MKVFLHEFDKCLLTLIYFGRFDCFEPFLEHIEMMPKSDWSVSGFVMLIFSNVGFKKTKVNKKTDQGCA